MKNIFKADLSKIALLPKHPSFAFNLEFFLLCIIAGLGGALFSVATDKAGVYGLKMFALLHYWVLIYIPIVFMIIVFIFKKYFPYAGGSGLPQGYALDVYEKPELYATYSLRTMFGKVILTVLSIFAGASLGREGPTIQICASIFSSLKNTSLERKKLLIRIGSGVGVATAFNAPLGGIVFAIEEYIQHSDSKINFFLLSGIAIAGYCSILVLGDYSYMGYIKQSSLYYSWYIMVIAVATGVVCGLIGALYTWLMVFVSVGKNSSFCKWRKNNAILSACIFGFFVAILGLATHGVSFGNGAVTSNLYLNSATDAPWFYALAKFFGSIFSVAAGVPGGYFSTSLSIGLGIMDVVHKLMPILPVQQFYLLGMVSFLAAITGAPITAVVMIVSVVADSQHFVLPLILSSLISAKIAMFFGESVYRQQVQLYIDKDKYEEMRH
ncbi:MAG: chloride channel protein [Burkholderiales bacterium]|nr:chloride channel protein [Burkholderiales bacterium]